MELISFARRLNPLNFRNSTTDDEENGAPKTRKLPVKVEPKVFFANERTFLAWLSMSVTLSTISLAIIAFSDSNKASKIYGLCLLPVAICFVAYSLHIYIKRAGMIRRKEPGPYDTMKGPITLAVILAAAIIALFIFKLYSVVNR